MRHVFGVLLALVMFAAVFVGAGWAVEKIVTLRASGGSLTTPHGVIALAVVAAVGLLLGILLAVPAVSPLAAGPTATTGPRHRDGTNSGMIIARPARASTPSNSMSSKPEP